ncbi:hypothetical protein AAG906_022701 [Vitis piasezkii]
MIIRPTYHHSCSHQFINAASPDQAPDHALVRRQLKHEEEGSTGLVVREEGEEIGNDPKEVMLNDDEEVDVHANPKRDDQDIRAISSLHERSKRCCYDPQMLLDAWWFRVAGGVRDGDEPMRSLVPDPETQR